MLCTLSLNGLAGALEVLSFVPGQEFEVLTVSFDPRRRRRSRPPRSRPTWRATSGPARTRGWHFLTGTEESIDGAHARRGLPLRLGRGRRSSSRTRRASLVLTPEGRISHYLFGVEYAPKDLRLALVDAAQGRIGNAADQLLLYCYQLRPADRPLQRVAS